MGIHRVAATEIPQGRSAIDTGDFTSTVGEFDAPDSHGDWHHHADHHIVAYPQGMELWTSTLRSGAMVWVA